MGPAPPPPQSLGSADGNQEKTREAGAFGGAGTTRFTGATVSVGLSQPIYRRELLMGLGQADARVRQSDAEFAFALQELMVRVSERYFDGLRAVDELEFRRSERDANERQLGQSRQRFEVGLIAVTDVEEAKAGFDLASARVIEAEAEVDNAREALREVTGVYLEPGTLKRLVAETPMAAPSPGMWMNGPASRWSAIWSCAPRGWRRRLPEPRFAARRRGICPRWSWWPPMS